MRLYVIGPVTGRENLNREAFEDARAKLEQAGYMVWTPHDIVPPDADHEDAMRLSIRTLLHLDGVAMLDGWDESQGALLENRVATACGLEAHCVGAWQLMAGVLPENDNSPEETANPPSDGAPAPSSEVLGALTRRMDETNALLRAIYYQIGAGIALDAAFLKGEHVEEAKRTALAHSNRAEAYFDDAGKENQDGRA